MGTGAVILAVAVVLALAFGLWRSVHDGRFRRRAEPAPRVAADEHAGPPEEPVREDSVLDGTPWAAELGDRATLLQFSSAFCAPCRATRQVLGSVAEELPGIVHIEVDAEQHLDLVRRLHVLRTPTTLVLDRRGAELARAGGAPSRAQVRAMLDSVPSN